MSTIAPPGPFSAPSFIFTIAVALSPAAAASAASLTWNGTTGNAATAARWSPAQQPTAADDLLFTGSNTFTITFDSVVPDSNSHSFRNSVNATVSVTSAHTIAGTLNIGPNLNDNATVHLAQGPYTVGGNVTIASVIGSSGTLTLSGLPTSLVISGPTSDMIVGRFGHADLTLSLRASIDVGDDFQIGSLANGGGVATLSDGSNITTNSADADFFVGNLGDGTLYLQTGSFVHAGRDFRIAPAAGSTGDVNLSGTFSFLGSRIIAERNLDIAGNDTNTAAGTATLLINSAAFANIGELTRIGDPNGGSGTLTLNSGVLSSPDIDIQSTGTIAGTGTINGDITNLGHITPTGAAGITINGILFNETSDQLTGTKFTFGPGGGYTGSGTCETFISGDPTSVITATGPLTMGVGVVSGFTFAGTIDVGTNLVTLVNTIDARLNGPVHVNGGVLAGTNGIGIQPNGTLDGHGTIGGQLIINGELDPHNDGPIGGEFLVQGNLIFNAIAHLDIELGGPPAAGNFDHVFATGGTFLDGDVRVRLKNGYIPHVGDQFVIVNAIGGRTNIFASITPPSPASCNSVAFDLVYTANSAILKVRSPFSCSALGDLNNDGDVNGKDIQPFINTIVSATYNPCADLNGDCQTTPPDLQAFITALLQ